MVGEAYRNLIGRQFGNWLVTGLVEKIGHVQAQCLSCKRTYARQVHSLKNGRTFECKSCATIRRHTKHGMCESPEYYAWLKARQVGAVGKWKDFRAFLVDMGLRPNDEHIFFRPNVDEPYGPGNARWAPRGECLTLILRRRARWKVGPTKALGPVQIGILDALMDARASGLPGLRYARLARITTAHTSTVTTALRGLLKRGVIQRPERGLYCVAPSMVEEVFELLKEAGPHTDPSSQGLRRNWHE